MRHRRLINTGRPVAAALAGALALAACDGGEAPASGAPAGSPAGSSRWEPRAEMPEPARMYVGVTAVRDRVFVVGGFGRPGDDRIVQSYDPAADRWEVHPELPRSFPMPNVAGVGGKLFVLGGLAANETLEYDPDSRRYTARRPLPVEVGRGAAAVGVIGTKVVVAGGITPGRSANMLNTGVRQREVFAYDTVRDEWEPLPDMPLPRAYAMAGVLGSLFFVAGGSTDFVRTDQVDALDLGARRWVDRPPLPWTLSSAAAAVLGGRLHVVGGIATETGTITPETLVMDPATGGWGTAAPMGTPRFAMGAAAVAGRLYVPAGAALVRPPMEFQPVRALEVFVP